MGYQRRVHGGHGQVSHQSVSKPYQGEHRSTTQSKAFGAHAAVVADAPNRLHGADAVVPTEFTPSTPLSPTTELPTLSTPLSLLTLCMPPPSLLTLSMLPPPITPPLLPTPPLLTMPLLRSMLMRFPPTPSPTLSLMTTPRPPSMLRSSPMVPPTLPEDTQLLFPTAGSSM